MVVRATTLATTARAINQVTGSGGGAGGGGGSALTLDNITSAVLAWSIARKLRTAHSGGLIRVRESGGSTEADIGAADDVLDESALTTHTGANSGFLTKYIDQSGHASAVDFIQATTTLQPRIVNAGTIEKDGGYVVANQKAAASPDGYCEANNWATRPSSAVAFVVANRGPSSPHYMATQVNNVYAAYAANGQTDTTISANAGTTVIDVNGLQVATTGSTTRDVFYDALPASGLFLLTVRALNLSNAAWAYLRNARGQGISSLSPGLISEMIILDNPSTDEINAVEEDIATFYGITLS